VTSGTKLVGDLRAGEDMVRCGRDGYELVRNLRVHPSGWVILTTPNRIVHVPPWAHVQWIDRNEAHELASEAVEGLARIKGQA
jgi:hypothetical protein